MLCVWYGDEYWGWLDRRGKGWIVKDIECIRWVMKRPSFSYYLVGQVGNEGELELLADYDEAPRGCTNAVVAQKLDRA